MKKQSQIICAILLSFTISSVSAQISNITDLDGKALLTKAYEETNGSPYSAKVWSNGSVMFANGKSASNIALKYDQVKDQLLFQGKNNEEYYFNDPIKEFVLNYTEPSLSRHVFANGFPAYKDLTTTSYYEILVEGKTKLLKKNAKSLSQVKEFNSATTTVNVNDNVNYYLFKDGVIEQISKKADLTEVAKSLAKQDPNTLNTYITSNKKRFNVKREEQLMLLVDYYNTLP